jgi:hypothetical protein
MYNKWTTTATFFAQAALRENLIERLIKYMEKTWKMKVPVCTPSPQIGPGTQKLHCTALIDHHRLVYNIGQPYQKPNAAHTRHIWDPIHGLGSPIVVIKAGNSNGYIV